MMKRAVLVQYIISLVDEKNMEPSRERPKKPSKISHAYIDSIARMVLENIGIGDVCDPRMLDVSSTLVRGRSPALDVSVSEAKQGNNHHDPHPKALQRTELALHQPSACNGKGCCSMTRVNNLSTPRCRAMALFLQAYCISKGTVKSNMYIKMESCKHSGNPEAAMHVYFTSEIDPAILDEELPEAWYKLARGLFGQDEFHGSTT